VIRWLLDKGVGLFEINHFGETVLHVAVRAGHLSVIRMLLIELICSKRYDYEYSFTFWKSVYRATKQDGRLQLSVRYERVDVVV
jgi:hypothetical protein